MTRHEEHKQGLVEIKEVSKIFPSKGQDLVALDKFSAAIHPGEFLVIVGTSGCGKSTLLKLVAGLDKPSGGTIRIDGTEVTEPRVKNGVVFQSPALFPWLDVMDNVTFGPRNTGSNRKDAEERALHYLKEVGLQGFERFRTYNLSGGMQHRVALARALINRPDLLLMDEPFGALDAQTRLIMQQLLMEIWQEDRSSVLFITHDVEEALVLADRVVVMTARPGRFKLEYRINLSRPRDLSVMASAEFLEFKRQIMEAITEETISSEAQEFETIRRKK